MLRLDGMVISRYRGRPCGAGRDGQGQARHLKHGRGAAAMRAAIPKPERPPFGCRFL
jgi:hypothetical protein